jgi:hypothetical protein
MMADEHVRRMKDLLSPEDLEELAGQIVRHTSIDTGIPEHLLVGGDPPAPPPPPSNVEVVNSDDWNSIKDDLARALRIIASFERSETELESKYAAAKHRGDLLAKQVEHLKTKCEGITRHFGRLMDRRGSGRRR